MFDHISNNPSAIPISCSLSSRGRCLGGSGGWKQKVSHVIMFCSASLCICFALFGIALFMRTRCGIVFCDTALISFSIFASWGARSDKSTAQAVRHCCCRFCNTAELWRSCARGFCNTLLCFSLPCFATPCLDSSQCERSPQVRAFFILRIVLYQKNVKKTLFLKRARLFKKKKPPGGNAWAWST